ncbi:hypothetical protein N3K66_000673 [Trichothecium roseum]|uniref:Uncharacterized protein n=1 Tax=Trichothecium roseum TaxID=47278 RepID=A0ACC0VCX2_9HYPO|nr:hypothetical protein N3K66_000673 [Trichothecium roseum]
MVIRNITPNIATFSVPFSRFGTIKVGGRGTLVKLSGGGLAIFSPVALTEDVKAKITEMGGDIRYIVAPDIEHHIFISEWATAFPDAKIVGPEGLPEKREKQTGSDPKIGNEKFSVVFKKEGKRDIRIGDDFDADFEYEYMDGHANKEIAFFYKPDRVLIQADIIFNLPCKEQYSRVPEAEKQPGGILARTFEGVQSPGGDPKWIRRFQWYIACKDKESFTDSVKRMDQWDFVTMIPCHGETVEGTGKELYRKVFDWNLTGKH